MLNKSFSWSSFANAYLRENTNWAHTQWQQRPAIKITLNEQHDILLPIHYFSEVGIHHFTGEILLKDAQSSSAEVITFKKALRLLLPHADRIAAFSRPQIEQFSAQVLQSQKFIEASLQNHPGISHLTTGPLNFIEAEQGLLAGHNFHPAAKSRQQLAHDEWSKYSPEFGAKFQLIWLKVSRAVLVGDAKGQALDCYLNTLVTQSAPELLTKVNNDFAVIPMHPWQWQYLQGMSSIKTLMSDNLVSELGEYGLVWSATSSVRAICQPDVDYQLKYSLNIKLTNSLRTLSIKECKRGLRVFDACQTDTFKHWQARYPEFVVLQEPAWCALSFNDTVIEESIFLFRENQQLNQNSESLVLATLGQLPIDTQNHLLLEQLKRVSKNYHVTLEEAAELWFNDFSKKVILPLCDLQANLGLVCLAHQQNIVIEFAQGLPRKTLIRDCQGFGFSELGIEQFAKHCKDIHGDIEHHWNQAQITRYFPYYVIINSSYAMIAALSQLGFKDERTWCQKLHLTLSGILSAAKDKQCLQLILEQPSFECKGNFYCYLTGDNENTIEDPAVIYFDMTNLLAQTQQ
ncbi:IucA/IucC family protein [Pseudoalteromonas sp. YIC-827]|uniref:IucA/IucC family protein n=1 Tax=Pseudoalteromonas qingdaonensis TaxID=3131913 RepID=A0ABU9MTF2_9GAMM